MKIVILTQPLHTNYGGLLQAFALQRTLEILGHEVLVADIQMRKSLYRNFRVILGRFRRKYFGNHKEIDSIIRFRPTKAEDRIIRTHTDEFIKDNIKTTVKINGVQQLYKLKPYHFDTYIVGSDQVWRPMFSPGLTAYYLDFLDNRQDVKRIAYAASFGVDFWEYDDVLTATCKPLIQKFDAVSVREDSAVKLCRENFDIDAVHVLDPTMLLEQMDYIALINKYNVPLRAKTLMAYVLDRTEDKDSILQTAASRLGLSVNRVMPKKKYSAQARHTIQDCVFPPVAAWLRGFLDAEFVVTDSFHGTIFSLIFNKPFIVIANKERGLARFTSLLNMFELEDRLIFSKNELTNQLFDTAIDFDHVNQLRKRYQKKAFAFLQEALA